MSKYNGKAIGGGINSLSKLRNYSEGGISRGDSFSAEPSLLIEEEGFNSHGAFAVDYWNRPDVVAHVRGFAESYKAGRFVPPIVRNGEILVRDGAHRCRGLMLAISEGAVIEKFMLSSRKATRLNRPSLFSPRTMAVPCRHWNVQFNTASSQRGAGLLRASPKESTELLSACALPCRCWNCQSP
jgi:hypothetical protein